MKPSFTKNRNKFTFNSKNNYNNEITNQSNPILNAQIGNSQIISGYFLDEKSYKEMVVQRVNNFLYIVLITLVVFCFIGYYFVSCNEVKLNQISRETLELNYENDELQNKVDTLQSYYNIDKTVSKSNILERAKHVVEIDAINLPNVNFEKNAYKKSLVVSY